MRGVEGQSRPSGRQGEKTGGANGPPRGAGGQNGVRSAVSIANRGAAAGHDWREAVVNPAADNDPDDAPLQARRLIERGDGPEALLAPDRLEPESINDGKRRHTPRGRPIPDGTSPQWHEEGEDNRTAPQASGRGVGRPQAKRERPSPAHVQCGGKRFQPPPSELRAELRAESRPYHPTAECGLLPLDHGARLRQLP